MTSTDCRPMITIWESAGSQMEAIADRLGELLDVPVHGQAVSSIEIARAFDPDSESDDSALTKLLHNLGPDAQVQTTLSQADLDVLKARLSLNTRAIRRLADEGGILLGRNGAYILRDRHDVLHVWLDGPQAERVNRAADDADEATEFTALRLGLEDRLRAEMSVFSYGYDPRNIEYYDLVLNTCRLDVESAAQIIAAAARVHCAQTKTPMAD